MAFMPPAVEPEQPPTAMINTSRVTQNGGQALQFVNHAGHIEPTPATSHRPPTCQRWARPAISCPPCPPVTSVCPEEERPVAGARGPLRNQHGFPFPKEAKSRGVTGCLEGAARPGDVPYLA